MTHGRRFRHVSKAGHSTAGIITAVDLPLTFAGGWQSLVLILVVGQQSLFFRTQCDFGKAPQRHLCCNTEHVSQHSLAALQNPGCVIKRVIISY